jgi:vacuolar-type H+-ATPase subunit E/Vma4
MNPDPSASERARSAIDSTASAVKSSAERTEERVNDWAENQSEESTFSKVKTAVSSAASKVEEYAFEVYESVSSHLTRDSSKDRPNIPDDV